MKNITTNYQSWGNSMNKKLLTLFLLLIAISTTSIVSAADAQKLVVWNLMFLNDILSMPMQEMLF